MATVSTILWLFVLISQYNVCYGRNFGGKLLHEAMDAIMGKRPTSNATLPSPIVVNAGVLPISRVRTRCELYLACENTTPMLEIENAIIKDGTFYFNKPDAESLAAISRFPEYFAQEKGRLPSCLGKASYGPEWIPGPKYVILDDTHERPANAPKQCSQHIDTSVHFLYPWEQTNAFHALNDNVLKVLCSMVMQRFTQTGPPAPYTKATLYVFDRLMGGPPTVIYSILNLLFEGDVRSASTLFKDEGNGAKCVTYLSWGNGIKPLYKDSLLTLRRTVYKVFQYAIRQTTAWPKMAAADYFTGMQGKVDDKAPKVVIVTRSYNNDNNRKIASRSEFAIVDKYKRVGVPATVCCDFSIINNVPQLLSYFSYADICIGVHGAGLGNCFFANDYAIMLEFGNWHNFGFDGFARIAHMTGGAYIFHDIRKEATLANQHGNTVGAVFDADTIQKIVDTTLKVHAAKRGIIPASEFKKTKTATSSSKEIKRIAGPNNNNANANGNTVSMPAIKAPKSATTGGNNTSVVVVMSTDEAEPTASLTTAPPTATATTMVMIDQQEQKQESSISRRQLSKVSPMAGHPHKTLPHPPHHHSHLHKTNPKSDASLLKRVEEQLEGTKHSSASSATSIAASEPETAATGGGMGTMTALFNKAAATVAGMAGVGGGGGDGEGGTDRKTPPNTNAKKISPKQANKLKQYLHIAETSIDKSAIPADWLHPPFWVLSVHEDYEFNGHQIGLLGPLNTEVFDYCMTFPYYKFRVLTQKPEAHEYACDTLIKKWRYRDNRGAIFDKLVMP